jgi:hypothetical protein
MDSTPQPKRYGTLPKIRAPGLRRMMWKKMPVFDRAESTAENLIGRRPPCTGASASDGRAFYVIIAGLAATALITALVLNRDV